MHFFHDCELLQMGQYVVKARCTTKGKEPIVLFGEFYGSRAICDNAATSVKLGVLELSSMSLHSLILHFEVVLQGITQCHDCFQQVFRSKRHSSEDRIINQR